MSGWTWKKIIGVGVAATVVIWLVALAPVFGVIALLPDKKVPVWGSAGDMFGASAALFGGLGFLGVVFVLYADLKQRRDDLTHRQEDLTERKQSRTPFLVPSVAEEGARVVRATRVDGRYAEATLTLELLIQNVTDEPAMNIALTSSAVGHQMPNANTEIDDTPFGSGEAAKKKASLHFSASGEAAEQFLQRLADGVQTRILICLEYASVNGTRWSSKVSYELAGQPAERELFQRILDNDSEAFVEKRPGFGSGDDVFLAFKIVPNSWEHDPIE